jgi:hypothetical protein
MDKLFISIYNIPTIGHRVESVFFLGCFISLSLLCPLAGETYGGWDFSSRH